MGAGLGLMLRDLIEMQKKGIKKAKKKKRLSQKHNNYTTYSTEHNIQNELSGPQNNGVFHRENLDPLRTYADPPISTERNSTNLPIVRVGPLLRKLPGVGQETNT